jgi:hypothetical protein
MNQKSDAPDWSSYKLGWEDGVMAERQSHRQTPLYTAPVDGVTISEERVDETAERKHMTDLARVGEVGVWGEREWVGLTDEEIDEAVKSCNTTDTYKYFRAIETKLKEKNA